MAEVNEGLQQMDIVTQQNAATSSSRMPADAEVLSNEAAVLKKLVSHFDLGTDGKAAQPGPARKPAPAEEAWDLELTGV